MLFITFGNVYDVLGSQVTRELEAGGKPSTWFPPGGLVEHQIHCTDAYTHSLLALKIFNDFKKYYQSEYFSNFCKNS